jgi:hypothetical protein
LERKWTSLVPEKRWTIARTRRRDDVARKERIYVLSRKWRRGENLGTGKQVPKSSEKSGSWST